MEMDADTRRRIEETVVAILNAADMAEASEAAIRASASERLGIDLSLPDRKRFVRGVVEAFIQSKVEERKSDMAEGEEEAGEEEESEEEEETKKRSGEMEYDEEGNLIICHLNDKRRVTISEFKGKKLVSIREYYEKNGKQLPSNKGLNSKAKSRLSSKKRREPQVEPIVSQEGSTTPVDMPTSLFVEKSVEGQSSSQRPQIEPVGFDDGGNVTVVFSKAVCSYSDPSSIEGHVESLLHPRDEARPIEIGHFEASNYSVSESYRALQAAIFLRRDHATLDKKARTLASANTALRAKNQRLVAAEREARAQMSEEVACLKAELGVKDAALAAKDAELKVEKKKSGELFETISVSTGDWDVEGKIEVYKELLREDADTEVGVPRTDEYEDANPLVESIEVGVDQSGLVVEPPSFGRT